MSMGEEEDLILPTRTVRFCLEIGEKQSKIDGQKTQVERGINEGMMLALTSLILPTKKERKLLQFLFDQTGTSGGAVVTMCVYWWR